MGMAKSGGLAVLLKGMPVMPLLKGDNNAISSLISQKRPQFLSLFDEEIFARACLGFYYRYSEEEARHLHRLLVISAREFGPGDLGLLSLIMGEADEYLRWDGNEIRCKHEKIIQWQQAVRGIGQSIFISAFLAKEDYLNGITRDQILVSPYIKTDNLRLRQMLMQGMAENHFHLKGSAPSFLLSWVCLMNHVQRRQREFASPEMKQLFSRFPEEDKEESLHSLVKKAAAIRLMFYRLIQQADYQPLKDDVMLPLFGGSEISAADLQRDINKQRYNQLNSLDYVVDTQSFNSVYGVLAGEHTFLYSLFRAIIGREARLEPYLDFVYAYLLIYVRMYGEMTQSNDTVGFSNFQRYQARKEVFLENYPKYCDALIETAAGSVLENPAVKSFEVRIAPKSDAHSLDAALDKTIKLCNSTFRSQCSRCDSYDKAFRRCTEKYGYCRNVARRMFYVLHFVKQADSSYDDYGTRNSLLALVRCRHHRHRHHEVEARVYGIAHLRRRVHKTAGFVYGLDACNQEIGCRPEVFAPYFRYARGSKAAQTDSLFEDIKVPILRITYHVGEDFLDVVDGLRAISETIRFLDLKHGDRLGHALALGINAAQWYSFKRYVVLLPRQDLLDNAMWLQMAMRRYGFQNKKLEYNLDRVFQNQFHAVYSKTNITLEAYYDAWKLRGDYPEYYRSRNPKRSDVSLAKFLRGNDYRYKGMREKNPKAYALMHQYHYCPHCKAKGAEIEAFDISMEYVEMVGRIQTKMREEISRLGIAIETNPSSNYLIGTFKSYEHHPLIKFYNRGLEQSNDPQLFVSINTDDQGIFDTNLENEYALLACALESVRDERGNYRYQPSDVYQWLDSIRRMGMEQSFKLLENGGAYGQEGDDKH